MELTDIEEMVKLGKSVVFKCEPASYIVYGLQAFFAGICKIDEVDREQPVGWRYTVNDVEVTKEEFNRLLDLGTHD